MTFFFNQNFVKLVVVVLIQKCVFTDNTDGASSPTSPHQGNGVMAQPKKIKGIGFGDIFREGSVKLRVSQRLPSDNEEKKEKVSVLHMTMSYLPSSESFVFACTAGLVPIPENAVYTSH